MGKMYVMDEDAIKKLCGAVRELNSVSEALDDENLSTESTFSSVKIKEMIDAIPTFDGNPDDFILKENIKTVITGGCTDEQVPSAKALYDVMVSKVDGMDGVLSLTYYEDENAVKVEIEDHDEQTLITDENIGDYALTLNGGTLDNGARINIPSSENGVGTLIDGNYITIDDANTSKSSTITADGIDTPSLTVGGKDVLTKSGGEMNANANLKFKGSNDNAYTEIYENGVDIYDNSGNSTFVASDIIETPEVKTKKISMENGTISMPSTGLGASIGIRDDYLYASLYADGLYIEDSDEHTSTHVGAGGITTPLVNGYTMFKSTNIDVADKLTNAAYTGTSDPYFHIDIIQMGSFIALKFNMYNVTFSSSSNIVLTFDGTEEYYDLLNSFTPLSYVLPSIVNTAGPSVGTAYLSGDVILNRTSSQGKFSGFTLKFPNQTEDKTVSGYPYGTTAIGYIK